MWTVFHQMWFWIKSWSKKDHSSPWRGIEFRSPAWQAGMLTTILPRNCVTISFTYHFSPSFQRYFSNEILSQKKCIPLLGGELNSGLWRWQAGMLITILIEELHAQNSLWTVFHQMRFWIKSWSKKDHSSPRRGIEFRSPTRQAGILSIILPRYYVFRSFAHRFSASFQRCLQRNPEVKNFILLLGGELSFGLPRDRPGYSPLYYWGTTFVDRLLTPFSASFQRCFQIKSWS